jgi:nitrate reductase NapAB chaperone NapD
VPELRDRAHISSIIVHARPADAGKVRCRIEDLGGEVPAHDGGRFVVVVEAADEHGLVSFFDQVSRIEGVLSTSLVSHYVDEGVSEGEGDEAHAT